MRRLTVVAAAIAACLLPATEPAAAPSSKRKTPDRMLLAVLQGRCEKLVINGRDISSSCKAPLLNSVAPNGHSRFHFMRIDGTMTTFTGDALRQRELPADKFVHPVDGILVVREGKPVKLPAAGKCTFGNAYKGVSRVHCTAQTAEGTFEGRFVSDGEEPDVTELPTLDIPLRDLKL